MTKKHDEIGCATWRKWTESVALVEPSPEDGYSGGMQIDPGSVQRHPLETVRQGAVSTEKPATIVATTPSGCGDLAGSAATKIA